MNAIMMKNLASRVGELENKRIIEFFKKEELTKKEIRIYCLAYADGMMYLQNRKVYKGIIL